MSETLLFTDPPEEKETEGVTRIVVEGTLTNRWWRYEGDEWCIGDKTLEGILRESGLKYVDIMHPDNDSPYGGHGYDGVTDFGRVRITIERLES